MNFAHFEEHSKPGTAKANAWPCSVGNRANAEQTRLIDSCLFCSWTTPDRKHKQL